MQPIEAKTLEYIRQNPGCSYASLERFFDRIGFEWRGTMSIAHVEHEHVLFWHGWNAEAIILVGGLEARALIGKRPADPLTYLADGKGLTLPKLQSEQDLRLADAGVDHWLPVVFVPAEIGESHDDGTP